ncbi:MAG: dynein heavy chain, partial [Dietzia sp.]
DAARRAAASEEESLLQEATKAEQRVVREAKMTESLREELERASEAEAPDIASEVEEQAQKEARMERSLQRVHDTWRAACFAVTSVRRPLPAAASPATVDAATAGAGAAADGTNGAAAEESVTLLSLPEEARDALVADQAALQAVLASKHAGAFQDTAARWRDQLARVAAVCELLEAVQRAWLRLAPLFLGSAEVRRELPEEAERFTAADAELRAL